MTKSFRHIILAVLTLLSLGLVARAQSLYTFQFISDQQVQDSITAKLGQNLNQMEQVYMSGIDHGVGFYYCPELAEFYCGDGQNVYLDGRITMGELQHQDDLYVTAKSFGFNDTVALEIAWGLMIPPWYDPYWWDTHPIGSN